ncbi:hypothetical protein IQ07DRAFT_664960 [Pyrenochaeta sp. DS3sAY3a]|nr:hypothetical protein IQ07DRAFT_664960 [Pyrenochaeta sp. DS3sAY3a]
MSISTFSMKPTHGFDWSEDEDDDFDLEAHKAKADTTAPTLQELGPLQPAPAAIEPKVDNVVRCLPASESALYAIYKSPDLPAYPQLSRYRDVRYDYRVNWMVHKVVNMRDVRKWYLHQPSGLRNVVNAWDEEKETVPAVKPVLEMIQEEDEDEMATESIEMVEKAVEAGAEDAAEAEPYELMAGIIEDEATADAAMIERPISRHGFYNDFEEGLERPGSPCYFSDEDDEVRTIERPESRLDFREEDDEDVSIVERPESRLSFYDDDEEDHQDHPTSPLDESSEDGNENCESMASENDSSFDYPTGPVNLWADEDPKKPIVRLSVASDAGLFGTWRKGDKVVVRLPRTVRMPQVKPVIPLVKIRPVVPLPKAIPQPTNEVISNELEHVEAFDRDMAQGESPSEELKDLEAFDREMGLSGPAVENADEESAEATTDEGYSSNSPPATSPKVSAEDSANASLKVTEVIEDADELSLPPLPLSAETITLNEIDNANDGPLEAIDLAITHSDEETTEDDLSLLPALPASPEPTRNEMAIINDGPREAGHLVIPPAEQESAAATTPIPTTDVSSPAIKHLKRSPRSVDYVVGAISTSYQLLSPMNWFYASAFVAGVLSDAVRAISGI